MRDSRDRRTSNAEEEPQRTSGEICYARHGFKASIPKEMIALWEN